MNHTQDWYERLDDLIRKLLIANPNITNTGMQEALEQNGVRVGDVKRFLKNRRLKVVRRMIADASRITKIYNAAEFNERTNHSLSVLMALTNKSTTPPAVLARAAEAIVNISHKRLMTFVVLDIHMSDLIKEGGQLGERLFPSETFDPIMAALQNNMFRPATNAFKYLPETIVPPKINNPLPDVNTTTNPVAGRKFVTLIPVKDDRSFALPPK